jgi:DHA1 family tetracycline resistance protein-like MFS transporter
MEGRNARQASLGFIFVTLFLDVMGLGLIIPVLPKLIEQFTSQNIEEASTIYGLMVALYALMQFAFAPVLGSLSDQYGRRVVILISLTGAGIDYLLLAFAPNLSWLFIGRMIAGITAANITAVTAYIADISPPEKRAQNFGVVGMAFGLGFIAGPLLGGLLGDIGLRLPFLVVAGITLLNALYGFFVLPESLKAENRRDFSWGRANPIGSLASLGHYPIVLGLAVVTVLSGLAQNALQSVWVLYTEQRFHWDPGDVGISLAVVGLSAALVQGGLTGRIVPRIGERRAIVVGLCISLVAYIFYGLATQGWMMYLIPFFGALGFIAGPSTQAIISKSVQPNEQGATQGALTGVLSLTGVLGPVIATNVFRYFISDLAPIHMPGAPFFLGAFFLLLAVLLATWLFRRIRPPAQTTSQPEAAPVLGH